MKVQSLKPYWAKEYNSKIRGNAFGGILLPKISVKFLQRQFTKHKNYFPC